MVQREYLIGITKDYWNNYGYASLFVLALIGILVFEKEKIKRYAYLWYSLVTILVIYNPISLMIFRRFLEPSTFDQYYLRFYGLVPIMIVIAYGATLTVKKLTGVKKLVATAAICIAITFLGHSMYSEDWFTKAENRNKVPQDVVTICDVFADYEGDKIRIMAPLDVAVYLRQMDSRFSMPYSRAIPDEAYELTNAKPDPSKVVEYAKENNVDYVVVAAVENVLYSYLNYGFTLYGRTANYAILQPNDPTWLLTEYEDKSGDQGLAYTLKNLEDGTFIVIDGGNAGNEKQMRDVIKKNGGTVDVWILTHYHKDHIDTFNAIYENPKGIEIKDIYVTPLDSETFYSLNLQEWDDVDTYKKFQEITEGAENINYVKRDQVLEYSDGLKITFYNAMDDIVLNSEGREDIPNNDSLVFKIETDKRSALICADAHSRYIAEYLVKTYGEKLDADILQCAHHGNNSMPEDTGFYEAVSPEVAIFDGPDWLITSPEYTAGALAAYLKELGARVIWYKTAPNVFGL
ncbi:ComEC/Rec2 family competence protein [Pseudobutyrivibrio xylanivorans]|uniref:Beta-lactamase superfamily domain-containing protein n=1 Tax=Pseudobutyrivibrio xylanivorans DSM 14809 TaxID=1123012 RepID=A0A1M6GVW4_PSEXY|nr:MBL fold metallo-hydrolase [Pseudobutyrivibrio xylanivorans]SHJ14079.1 Beta-lactamase superfamily domain-containing protein [Pseudobutyrivibrio xylanivorans DSM 14809]